ncbi:MAG: 2-amino-4-hydroxy-6-hydroxymethyldihydropteridine diphosphokinase [Rhodothermales bacterium]
MNKQSKQVFLGLGANLGEKLGHLQWAVQQLIELAGIDAMVCSPVYESEAHVLDGEEVQPTYLNAVIGFHTEMLPMHLLRMANLLEKRRGRDRQGEARWASRTLDIDILAYGEQVVESSVLTVPHRRIADRKFVLLPWHDIAPSFLLPAPFSKTVKELLATCGDESELTKTSYNLLD